MHWLLSISEPFSLRQVIRQSGWLLHRPWTVHTSGDRLSRVEQLGPNTTVELTLHQSRAGLVLETESHLSGQEVEEVSRRMWRTLRLGQHLSPFVRQARYVDGLASASRWGARLVRGTSLFEDVLTASSAQWRGTGYPEFPTLSLLVDRLGSPLPSNPTLHAFPAAERVLDGISSLSGLLDDATARRMAAVAEAFLARGTEIESLVGRPLAEARIAPELEELVPLDATGLDLTMLFVDRYGHVPTDAIAQTRLREYRRSFRSRDLGDVMDFGARWQPWSGLAYWLWDWSGIGP